MHMAPTGKVQSGRNSKDVFWRLGNDASTTQYLRLGQPWYGRSSIVMSQEVSILRGQN